MFTFETKIRVRYAETDQMGFVYYGNYATYYEVARVESLRSLGFSYKSLEQQGVLMPVAENKSKYIRPAKYDDLLLIRLKVEQLPEKRMIFQYEIYNEQNKLINLGETVLAFVERNSGKACVAPDTIINLLNPFFNGKN
jgi:acyl-CoA thioester hydrolase